MSMKANIFLITSAAFIATNIDELFCLILFFASAIDDKEETSIFDVVLGQYLAFTFLVIISLFGAGFHSILPPQYHEYIRLLGLVPLYIGITQLVGVINFWSKKFSKRKQLQTGVRDETSLIDVKVEVESSGGGYSDFEFRGSHSTASSSSSSANTSMEETCLYKHIAAISPCLRPELLVITVTLFAEDGAEEVGMCVCMCVCMLYVCMYVCCMCVCVCVCVCVCCICLSISLFFH